MPSISAILPKPYSLCSLLIGINHFMQPRNTIFRETHSSESPSPNPNSKLKSLQKQKDELTSRASSKIKSPLPPLKRKLATHTLPENVMVGVPNSGVQIYNEQITDLLDPSQRNLQIREDVKSGVYVENLTEEYICTMKDVTQLLIKVHGHLKKQMHAYNVFIFQLRSHVAIRHLGCLLPDARWKKGDKAHLLKRCCSRAKCFIGRILMLVLIRHLLRPIGLMDKEGCVLVENNGIVSLDIFGSLSWPIGIIDSRKFLFQALPFSAKDGEVPPREIVAVVRPANAISSSASKKLDQKHIVKNNLEMIMEIGFIGERKNLQKGINIYAAGVPPTSTNSLNQAVRVVRDRW
ncbi:hypothetical protein Pint_25583 [Pistacia integerrima]|uniref:Uncharacterized protein n=1 Tax=Pistacia integerrima TaxID=434235 RepID=A0ACC0YF24_9ROSI|nr:hypothetical protein Pint_25583 [Pistacia integerrima]